MNADGTTDPARRPAPRAAGAPRAPRAPRSDALRNRDLLVAAARAAFADAEGAVPLEGVARAAGVGIGTLYRHFPTREALVEAVYAAELDDLTAAAPELLRTLPPDRALRAWMHRYGEFFAAKRGFLDTLRAGLASGRISAPATRERINAALGSLLEAGAAARTLRGDVPPDDVTVMLLGIFLHGGDDAAQTGRLVELLADALKLPHGA